VIEEGVGDARFAAPEEPTCCVDVDASTVAHLVRWREAFQADTYKVAELVVGLGFALVGDALGP
jgi:hypothetical protein